MNVEKPEKYKFQIASEAQVRAFYLKAMIDPTVAGYLSLGPQAFVPTMDETTGLWTSVYYTNGDCTALGSLHIQRGSRNDVSISGYVLEGNKLLAGRLAVFMRGQIKLVSPHSVNSTVLVSNAASMRLTTRLLGEPWGIEPDAGYDGVLGKWVGIAYFRRNWEDIK
jgi:hypothetical protein